MSQDILYFVRKWRQDMSHLGWPRYEAVPMSSLESDPDWSAVAVNLPFDEAMSMVRRLEKGEESKPKKKIWECKIGEVDEQDLPEGSDLPMRLAVQEAYYQITGQRPQFTFSGWGAELTEQQRALIDKGNGK